MKIYENTIDLNLDGEIWKDIDGYNGDYQVSNYGRVKSFKGKDIKILSQIIMNTGYLYVHLYKNRKCKIKFIHVLSYETFNNYILKEDDCVHHIDENKLDNILDNFQLMTKSNHMSFHMSGENHHMYEKHHSEETKKLMSEKKSGKKHPEHSKKMSGENNPSSVLTEQNIIEIRKLSDEGILSQREIGKMFGVKQTTISKIKNGKIWKKNYSNKRRI